MKISKQAMLRRRKPCRFWQTPQFEYEPVTVIAVGSRHKGNYAGNAWDYRDVLIETKSGDTEEVASSQLFFK